MPLTPAENQPLTTEKLRDQLGRLGGTPFTFGELANHLTGAVMLPVSELNRLRRTVVAELERQRAQPKRWQLNPGSSRGDATLTIPDGFSQRLLTSAATNAELIVLVRNLAQLEAALQCGTQTVYCEFENPKKYREAVTLFRTAHGGDAQPPTLNPQPSIWVAPPRIFKTGEEWTLNQVRSCNADGYLVRNYDHLQLEALLSSAPPEWFEITIHQHMPMFHMEHCVFCAFLSSGTDYTNCGRPCDVHEVKLRDRVGAEHPLKADVGCRNTVFNSIAQTGAEYVARMLMLGVRNFLNETPAQVTQTIAKYRQLLRGEISGTQLWRELKLANQLGVTRGQMAG